MKVDNSTIHRSDLLAFINQSYSIGEGVKIEFIPKGEEGYCYSLETKTGEQYFVKAIKTEMDLSTALSAIHYLHFHEKKTYLLPPILSKSGDVVVHFGPYQVSIFPYIKGKSIYEDKITLADTVKIAKMMADFHRIDIHKIDGLSQEQFANPFEKNILAILHTIEENDNAAHTYRQQAKELFAKEQEDLRVTLNQMKIIQNHLQALPLKYSITHGDPNTANIIRDEKGFLHLIDFGWLAYGPVERDVFSFTDNDFFQPFLLEYVKHHHDVEFHIEVFKFYLYRWALQEISDYGSQLFFGSTGDEENEHAWNELQPYLPIPHKDIAKSLINIRRSCLNVKIEKIR
ncbi:phosphotransferase enzyme family protein [Lederbergia citri]|uniref:Phosphotransferase n=1 Tax=Lederbergia citri TaxID=2833580 RepID=A0A942TAW4_9BACI|nr:phosphotransferase [Lederbergia citri]MBS4194365.1 phosphotransferase [Lederbergia citri]